MSSDQPADSETTELPPLREGDDISLGKFHIEVLSVFYKSEQRTCRAAVVLKTTFLLHGGRKLKHATCPIAAHPRSGNQELYITDYHPKEEEVVEVERSPGVQEWIFKPSVNVTGFGGIQLGSFKQSRIKDDVRVISLNAMNHQEKIPNIEWQYIDENNTRYPGSVHLLVVVQNSKPTSWFEFELQLMAKLEIVVHRTTLFPFDHRLSGRPERGDGWRFKIRGRYNEAIAQNALESIGESGTVPTVGLRAAVAKKDLQHPEKAGKSRKFSSLQRKLF